MNKRRMLLLFALLGIVGVAAVVARLWPRAALTETPQPDLAQAEPQVRAKIEAMRALLEAAKNDPEAWGRYGLILHAHGLLDGALIAYGEAKRLAPREFRWPYYRGLALESLDPPAALREFDQALRLRSDYPPLHVWIGRLRLLNHDPLAAAAFHAALGLNPDIGPAHVGLGQIAEQQGDLDSALSHYRSAVLIDETDAAAHAAIARIAARKGLNDEAAAAEALARRHQGRTGRLPDPLLERLLDESVAIEAYLSRSESYRRTGQFAAALRELNLALQFAPDHPFVHAAVARLFGQRGDFENAAVAARHALDLKPDLPGGHRLLAMALGYQNQFEEAATHIAAALAEDPEDAEMHHLEGVRLALLGRYADAIPHFETAARIKPADFDVQQALAQAYSDAGRPADSIRVLRPLGDAPNPPPGAALQLGWILATSPDDALRDGAAAERLLRPLLDGDAGREPERLDALAAALAEQGRFEDAIALMTEVVTVAEQRGMPETIRRQYGARLTLYRQHQPYRQPVSGVR